MLIAAFLTLLVTLALGGSHDTFLEIVQEKAAKIESIVKDEGRAKEAQRVLEGMVKVLEQFQRESGAIRTELWNVDSDYHAGQGAYEAVFRKGDEFLDRTERELLDLRFRLKEHVRREEWKKLFPPP